MWIQIEQRGGAMPSLWIAPTFFGVLFIIFGLLVLAHPEILVLLASGLAIALGLLLVAFGLSLRKSF